MRDFRCVLALVLLGVIVVNRAEAQCSATTCAASTAQFVGLWCEGDPAADVNGDGLVSFSDIIVFFEQCLFQCGTGNCSSLSPGSGPCRFETLHSPTQTTSVTVVATFAGTLTLTTSTATGEACQITVHAGSAGSPGGAGAGSVSFAAQAGEVFGVTLRANGHLPCSSVNFGNVGAVEVTGGCDPGASVSVEPEPVQACVGQPMTLTYVVAAMGAVEYQWFQGGVALSDGPGISGSATSSLTLTFTASASALLTCRATFGCNQELVSRLVSVAAAEPGSCCSLVTGQCTLTDSQCRCPSSDWVRIPGGVCSPNTCEQPAACCYSDGTCALRTSTRCTDLGTASATFRPDAVCQASGVCEQPAACCFEDGRCQFVLPSECVSEGGVGATPRPGLTCVPQNLCAGAAFACCHPWTGGCVLSTNGACPVGYAPADGASEACTPMLCQPPMIACCTKSGCGTTNILDCTLEGLVTMSCAPGVCDADTGVCCNPATGECRLLDVRDGCPSGWLATIGIATCAPNPCQFDPPGQIPPTGACCTGSTCAASITSYACEQSQGRFVVGSACNAPGNATTPCCKADYNGSGGLSVQDIFDYLAGYFGQDMRADFNQSQSLTVQDLFDFLAAYFAGCA